MKRYYFFTIIFLVVIFALVGCTKKDQFTEDASWKDTILWAQECGLENLICCTDKEPVCNFGLSCCSDPNNGERQLCREECSCGDTGDFCCAEEPQCQNGLACFNGDCVVCGNEGQPCCAAQVECNNLLVCHKDQCVECGLPGNPCCEGDNQCIGQSESGPGRTECRNEVCIRCGYGSKIACQGEPSCNQGHLLNNDFCYLCGEYNQPCCNEQSGLKYECNPDKGLICQLGFCSK